jgi:cyclopropane fatty-acyl-phospholipid synthase-like methyltransferase
MSMLYQRGNAAKQWIFEELHRRFADRSATILDMGCGDGSKWPPFLTDHARIRVVGIDTDRAAIKHGMATYGSPQLELRVGDAQRHADGVYDAVVAFSAIEHVVDRAAFLKTVWAALSSGGVAYLNYDDGHFRSSNWKERAMVPASQVLAAIGIQGPYMKHVDDVAFRRLAEAQGFRVLGFRKHNLHPLKGFMRGASDDAVRHWYDFEERLGQLYKPEELDKIMWSSTLQLQKP